MPASRNAARRHRGSHRMVPQPKVQAPDPVDLAAELEWEVPDPSARRALEHWQQNIDKPLFVYFIQEEKGGPIKIGQALNPIKRLRNLQCGNPRILEIQAVVLAAVDTEKRIHDRWGPAGHIRGEWFGNGIEQALLAVARGVSAQQIEAHGKGEFVHRIAAMATYGINYPQWQHGLDGLAGIS